MGLIMSIPAIGEGLPAETRPAETHPVKSVQERPRGGSTLSALIIGGIYLAVVTTLVVACSNEGCPDLAVGVGLFGYAVAPLLFLSNR
jgi:hypothetical protein